ncbi:MAG: 16S rRNA (uracil(1498)-N(3))-methyltransferase [Kiritimatiellae bacterium]|nr:16S rRNA (uracil(1498)-N(3))-methyltransferase [Kiritimatiellia bacterium]
MTAVHRILVDTDTLLSGEATLSKDAAKHLRVVRAKLGEDVELFDGAGRTRIFNIAEGGALAAAGDATMHPRLRARLTLFACLTKQNRWEWMLEKVTELGATHIVPVMAERCVVKIAKCEAAKKLERWNKIAEEAARQSHAVWLPEIHAPVSFAEALEIAKNSGKIFAGALMDGEMPEPIAKAAAKAGMEGDAGVFIGPEGDFSPAELAALLAMAQPVSLGPTVLRAETAAIFAVAVLAALRQ